MSDRDFWVMIRQALLVIVDAIERKWDITPRTSDLRRAKAIDLKH